MGGSGPNKPRREKKEKGGVKPFTREKGVRLVSPEKRNLSKKSTRGQRKRKFKEVVFDEGEEKKECHLPRKKGRKHILAKQGKKSKIPWEFVCEGGKKRKKGNRKVIPKGKREEGGIPVAVEKEINLQSLQRAQGGRGAESTNLNPLEGGRGGKGVSKKKKKIEAIL